MGAHAGILSFGLTKLGLFTGQTHSTLFLWQYSALWKSPSYGPVFKPEAVLRYPCNGQLVGYIYLLVGRPWHFLNELAPPSVFTLIHVETSQDGVQVCVDGTLFNP